jgi:hypothetical protein
MAVSYGPGRVRASVTGPRGQDAKQTYADLIRVLNEKTFVCLVCENLVDFGGKPAAQLSMSSGDNIVAHLARCAPHELTASDRSKKAILTAAKSFVQRQPAPAGLQQLSFRKLQLPPVDDLAAELALWVLTDSQPFSVVSSEGFVKLWDVVRPGEKLPSADTVTRRAVLLDEALQRKFTRNFLPSLLGYSDEEGAVVPAGAPFTLFSTTTDAWQSNAGLPYMGVTLHAVTPDFVMQTHTLAVRHFRSPHTAARYNDQFGGILEESGLPEAHMLACSTDSANSMLKFAEKASFVHFRCFAHALHNGVQRDVLGEKDVDPVLLAPAKYDLFFNNTSTKRNQIVADFAAQRGLPPPQKVIVPVSTRWSSYYRAVERHNERWAVTQTLTAAQLGITELPSSRSSRRCASPARKTRASTSRWSAFCARRWSGWTGCRRPTRQRSL